MKALEKNQPRQTVQVPHFEIVEAELPTAAEKEALLASLREGEEQFTRGDYVTYKKGMLLAEFRKLRAAK